MTEDFFDCKVQKMTPLALCKGELVFRQYRVSARQDGWHILQQVQVSCFSSEDLVKSVVSQEANFVEGRQTPSERIDPKVALNNFELDKILK